MRRTLVILTLFIYGFFVAGCEEKPPSPSSAADAGAEKPVEMRDNDPTTGQIQNINKNLHELKVDINEKSMEREANIDAKIEQ